jgi:hypothetical protein
LKQFLYKLRNWELWPFYVIYAPLGFAWLYYVIKARAFWFFSAVNPTLEFSGFEGENKKEMYQQLPSKYYPKTLFINARQNIKNVIQQISDEGFHYPFIVKPQIGMHGMMFRKIKSEEQLRQYHENISVDYIVQDFVDLPMEFSVFHIRYPGETKGKITGFIFKDYLAVTGNGLSTLIELIRQHPRAYLREEEMRHKHAPYLNNVIADGEKYYLSIAGNHNRGTRFINLSKEINEQLCDVFDKISREAGHFYFGRYDLKCTSVEDLKAGKNISILEFNGAGAEPNHIYDCGMSYRNALKIINEHWSDMYNIGRINNKSGVAYWSFLEGYKHLKKAKKYFKELYEADLSATLNGNYTGD